MMQMVFWQLESVNETDELSTVDGEIKLAIR